MKILLLGDSSGYHRTLSVGLRAQGHETVVASDGSMWMDTERDIDISRPGSGKLGGLALWLKMQRLCRGSLRGFDVVALHRPVFLMIRPQRQLGLFRLLRGGNRGMFLSATCADSYLLEESLDPASPLRYNEYRIHDRPGPVAVERRADMELLSHGPMRELTRHVYANIEGAMSALYEYNVALRRALPPSKIGHADIPVDTDAIGFSPLDTSGKIRLMLGRKQGQTPYKGTDLLEAAARTVADRHPGKVELTVVENVPLRRYLEVMRDSHIVLDQVYSYSPATNALQAMAMGRVAVSGAEPDYYDFIGEQANRPIVNAVPDAEALTATLEELVRHPRRLADMGRCSREFVERHNDARVVAGRCVDFWNRRLQAKEQEGGKN